MGRHRVAFHRGHGGDGLTLMVGFHVVQRCTKVSCRGSRVRGCSRRRVGAVMRNIRVHWWRRRQCHSWVGHGCWCRCIADLLLRKTHLRRWRLLHGSCRPVRWLSRLRRYGWSVLGLRALGGYHHGQRAVGGQVGGTLCLPCSEAGASPPANSSRLEIDGSEGFCSSAGGEGGECGRCR